MLDAMKIRSSFSVRHACRGIVLLYKMTKGDYFSSNRTFSSLILLLYVTSPRTKPFIQNDSCHIHFYGNQTHFSMNGFA